MNLRFGLVAVSVFIACQPHRQPAAQSDLALARSGITADRIPGCYEFVDGAWKTDKRLARFFSLEHLPRRIQFDTSKLRGWDVLQTAEAPLRSIRSLPISRSTRSPFVFWSRVRSTADTILVGAPLPETGARMTLWPVVGGLAGSITTFTDAIPPDGVAEATAPVRLRRFTCPND